LLLKERWQPDKAAVVEDKRAALIARNKLTTVGMLKSTKLTMILEQGKRLKQTNQH
jgi:hypothetical protein